MSNRSDLGMLERLTQKGDASNDVALETEIARCLSWLGDPAGLEHLKRLGAKGLGRLAWPLRSPGESAESKRARAVLRARAVAGLERAVREELSTLVRADAVNALVKLQREEAADVLAEILQSELPLPMRQAILNHLVRFRDERALRQLIGCTRSGSVTTRRWAVRELGRLGSPEGRAAVLAAQTEDVFWRRPTYWLAGWRTRRA